MSVARANGAAPAFQQQNSPERLAEIFKGLRSRKLDLSPIIVYTPKLFRAPEMNGQGLVRVTGFFPTEPERVNFDLIYQPVQGQWRLFGIAVEPGPAPQSSSSKPAAEPSAAAEKPTPEPNGEVSGEVKPAAPATPPKKLKPKAANETPSSVDVRDRLDSPPAPPPPEKPKKKSGWNPFGRE